MPPPPKAPAGRKPKKRGPGRPSGQTTEGTKRKLLEAAHREFSDLGYAAATTPQIAARAGVSQSVVYHHFGNKPSLYTAVIQWQVDLSLDAFEKAIEGRDSLFARIDGVLEAMLAIWPEYGHNNPILVMAPFEVRRHPELKAARKQLRRNETFFTRLVAEADDTAGVDQGLVQMCIALIWGLSGVGAISDVAVYLDAVAQMRRMLAGSLRDEQGPLVEK